VTRLLRDLRGADPYQVLGLTPGASDHDITVAHRRLIRQLHPDVSPGQEERAKLLNLARNVLRDPISRAEYDLSARRRTGSAAPVDFDDEIIDEDEDEDEDYCDDEIFDDDEESDEFTSVWDDEDVFSGPRVRPPAPPDPRWYPPPYVPRPQAFPPAGYYPPPMPVYTPPVRSGGISLGVWALILSMFCGPLGLPLAIMALIRQRPDDVAGRVCAIISLVLSSITLMCCFGYVAVGFVSLLQGGNGQ
jgi:hypothetical protein